MTWEEVVAARCALDGQTTVRQLQEDIVRWRRFNFPEHENWEHNTWENLLGMVEEMGELAHAMLKMSQGIRGTGEEHQAAARDAVGDLLVFTANFCERMGFDMHEIWLETWKGVRQRNWKEFRRNGVSE